MTEEDLEQATIFEWAELMENVCPVLKLLYAVPNGGYRPPVTVATLKRTGVKSGVPDMMLPVPRNGYHGLYIELKRRKGGKVSLNQKRWLIDLSNQGYYATVCYGADEAIKLIEKYLGI